MIENSLTKHWLDMDLIKKAQKGWLCITLESCSKGAWQLKDFVY